MHHCTKSFQTSAELTLTIASSSLDSTISIPCISIFSAKPSQSFTISILLPPLSNRIFLLFSLVQFNISLTSSWLEATAKYLAIASTPNVLQGFNDTFSLININLHYFYKWFQDTFSRQL